MNTVNQQKKLKNHPKTKNLMNQIAESTRIEQVQKKI